MAPAPAPALGATGGDTPIAVDRLTLNGDAVVVRTGPGHRQVLRLTGADHRRAGSAWLPERIDLRASFETRFDVLLHHGLQHNGSQHNGSQHNGSRHNGQIGADGIAFVLQESGPRALGGHGGGLGYRGLNRSVAVEFDDHRNGDDPDGNHVALVLDGDPGRHLTVTEAAIPLFGAPFQARVAWDAPTGVLRVYLGAPGADSAQLVIDREIDLRERLGADTAWMGFTGATGDIAAKQDVLSWWR
ncbi:L-type lectin-domain containing protein [Actinoplanes sp. NPDC051851]|uniref:L-type lectin-domain containing protein n=1 Tax=Actinoplanes sp. NPDC051851 TaxID=3154753 RepID=UPI0034390600